MTGPFEVLWVLLGGFAGGMLRFWVSGVVGRAVGETFPWGTLAVNVSGAVLVGVLVAATRSVGGVLATPGFRELAIVGMFGSYTTVSSFSLQTLNLLLDGQPVRALANVLLSVGLCLIGIAIGYLVGLGLFA